ncbi:MAG: hypothetical protein RLZZ383_2805, partial [Pseudomonadota bacterium]
AGLASAGDARTVGGVSASIGYFPPYGDPQGQLGGVPAIACLGGGAQHATARDWLAGGELGICTVDQGTAGFIGPEFGRRFPVSPYASIHTTVGVGFGYVNQWNDSLRYTSFDAYVKPGVWVAGDVGGAQTQLGLQFYTPVHLAQFLSGGATPRGFINPTIQLESRLYFGRPRRSVPPVVAAPTTAWVPSSGTQPVGGALAVPVADPDPAVVPLCPRGPVAPPSPADGEPPLAIPAP